MLNNGLDIQKFHIYAKGSSEHWGRPIKEPLTSTNAPKTGPKSLSVSYIFSNPQPMWSAIKWQNNIYMYLFIFILLSDSLLTKKEKWSK